MAESLLKEMQRKLNGVQHALAVATASRDEYQAKVDVLIERCAELQSVVRFLQSKETEGSL